jgi:hypothetical protein
MRMPPFWVLNTMSATSCGEKESLATSHLSPSRGSIAQAITKSKERNRPGHPKMNWGCYVTEASPHQPFRSGCRTDDDTVRAARRAHRPRNCTRRPGRGSRDIHGRQPPRSSGARNDKAIRLPGPKTMSGSKKAEYLVLSMTLAGGTSLPRSGMSWRSRTSSCSQVASRHFSQ